MRKIVIALTALILLCFGTKAESGTMTLTGGGGSLTLSGGGGNLALSGGSAASYMDSWSYRKLHTITGSTAGAVTNYPVKFVIYRSSGTDSGESVYLGTNVADDYDDLRFTSSDGKTFLDYWIESSDTSSATVWVEISSIPASPSTTTIYIYYGNASASAISNGDNTFTLFDHFTGSSVDSSKWTTVGTVSVASSILTVSPASNPSYVSNTSLPLSTQNYAYRTRSSFTYGGSGWKMAYLGTALVHLGSRPDPTSTHSFFGWDCSYSWGEGVKDIGDKSGYHIWEIQFKNSRTYAVVDGSELTSTDKWCEQTNANVEIKVDNSGPYAYADWVVVRRYVYPEPTHGSYGSGSPSPFFPPSGWDHRKSHVIAGSTAGAQTNYPMKFVIHRTTGTDSGQDVYVGTEVASDYDDLRFTSSDGATLLDYWIESSDSSSATVWVEIPSIPASPSTATIYMYYGSATAAAVSDGDSTFTLYDHFTGTSLDANKWTTMGSPTVTVASSLLTVTCGVTTETGIKSNTTVTYGTVIRIRQKDYDTGDYKHYPSVFGFGTSVGNFVSRAIYTNQQYALGNNNGTATYSTGVTTNYSWHIYDVTWLSSETSLIKDGTTEKSLTTLIPTGSLNINIGLGTGVASTSVKQDVDWIVVRKYCSPEPTHSTWGNQE